jgi:cysteinyl-tRNA synthetase
MTIKIFNSLSNRKEDFVPLVSSRVGMYVCGITAYDQCHIGHARAYVTADVLVRYLTYRGFDVVYVRNFTDIDDKIIKRASELGVSTDVLTERFIREFYSDMDALGVQRPQIEPRVTKHIPDIIHTVETLLARDHAYRVDGDVYFSVDSFPSYGRLSGRNLDDLKAGARVEVDDRKRNPLDFALWKSSKPGEPFWDSPWGPGRPGWHIECSTMSTKYLGETFDIHGGGKDLVFPHHENEIAQSEAATGKPFCRYFFHNGFVNIDKEKMSKSLGNFFTIREILKGYDPEALRLFLLTTHYRSPVNFEVKYLCPMCREPLDSPQLEERVCAACKKTFTDDQVRSLVQFPALEEAQHRIEYLYTTRKRLEDYLTHGRTGAGVLVAAEQIQAFLPQFEQAMDDDFNTAAALAVLSDALRFANEVLDNREGHPEALITSTAHALREAIASMTSVLGIVERNPQVALESLQQRAMGVRGVDAALVERLIAERNAARKNKDFKRSDVIREELNNLGVELMDGPQGTSWKVRT